MISEPSTEQPTEKKKKDFSIQSFLDEFGRKYGVELIEKTQVEPPPQPSPRQPNRRRCPR